MKHVFLVHSFTTYHCALQVMEREGLAGNDCVFVLRRDFVPDPLPEGSRCGTLETMQHLAFDSFRQMRQSFSGLRQADRELSSLLGDDDFHAYVPHTYSLFEHLVITHSRCRGFSYIEEGLTSYYAPEEIGKAYAPRKTSARYHTARRWLFPKRLPAEIAFYRDGHVKAYGLTPQSFPSWPRREVLRLPLENQSRRNEEHPPILVFDAFVELGMVEVEAVEAALKAFLAGIQGKVPKLLYKFHPGQTERQTKGALRPVLRSNTGVVCEELAGHACLEEIAARTRCDFYVFNSATGLYAALYGSRVFTLNDLVLKYSPGYARLVANLPAMFTEKVEAAKLQ